MCYDGVALRRSSKMSSEVLASVAEEVAPYISVVIPYGGSEPLIADLGPTPGIMAVNYSIELRITTNVQFLDEQTFDELKDISEALFLVGRRPHSRSCSRRSGRGQQVRRRCSPTSPPAARLADRAGLECLGQVVFMTKNAARPWPDRRLSRRRRHTDVNVLQLLDVNGLRSGLLDPLLRFSSEYVESVKRTCIETCAPQESSRLIWNVAGWERHDFRARQDRQAAQGLELSLGAAHEAIGPGLLHERLEPRPDHRGR